MSGQVVTEKLAANIDTGGPLINKDETVMPYFMNLADLIPSFQTDAATENDPVKRMFICDGEFMTPLKAARTANGR